PANAHGLLKSSFRPGILGWCPNLQPEMDRNLDVRTPESIALTYQLAGLGSRFLAVAIDMLLQVTVAAALLFGFVLAAARVAERTAALTPAVERIGEAVAIALLVAIAFTIFFGYFIAFEALWNGQTVGKKALGIRVVRDGGYPIDFGASLVRNLIRVGELILGSYALSAVAMLLSPENKRLGDIAAGTIVVRDARLAIPDLVARPESAPEPVYGATRYLSGDERSIVKRFLERRDALVPQRRRELAAQLAGRVRSRLPEDLQRLEDEPLLERL
ncbi:MAG TPA: RDD family protein, partial [Candidatus Tumulicola sp.]|nr:RDD family protein [Candidatus Tumulicola sp.]